MAIKTYSVRKDGDLRLSANFKVREFRCNDGSDTVLIDTDLVALLQKLRDKYKRPVYVNSGYRTVPYNEKIGGASGSYHCSGSAADVSMDGVSPLKAALYFESILENGGLGCYSYDGGGFVHVDTRNSKSRWVQAQSWGSYDVTENIMPLVSIGDRGQAVKIAQNVLGGIAADGIFGSDTLKAVKTFQKEKGLAADGIIGPLTWRKLAEE